MEPLVDRFTDLHAWYVDDQQLTAAREELELMAARMVKAVLRLQNRARRNVDVEQRLRRLKLHKTALIHALWIIEAEERRRRNAAPGSGSEWVRAGDAKPAFQANGSDLTSS